MNACEIDSYGQACKSNNLTALAISTAYDAGILDAESAFLKAAKTLDIDPLLQLAVLELMKPHYKGKENL